MTAEGNNQGSALSARPRGDLPDGSDFGSYRIRRRLGSGGMGAVYEAEQVGDGRIVALKLLSVDLDKMAARDRFLREGRSAAAVNHPNTVCVYRTEEIEGVPAICMELVADGTLEERVRTRGPLPVDEVVEFALQMIDGLAAAHDVGVLHRDVKPANCFVGADGTLKVGDFGLSKPVNAEEQLRLTQTGMFLGTPVFSSPEQLLGERLDVRSDIYAVGVTLYFALTGQLPYASGSMAQVIATVINGKPTAMSTYRSGVPDAVATVVLKAMARVVADRYQSYDEFRDAVAALRAPTVEAAAVGSRLRAWMIDAVVVVLVSAGPEALLQYSRGLTLFDERDGADPLSTLLQLLVALLVVAVPEGLTGKSLGKWLIGIQVVNVGGQPPGLAMAAARTSILFSCWVASDVVVALLGSGAALITGLVFRLATFSTARRSNGWRTVYDMVTRTRVIRTKAAIVGSRRRSQALPAPSREEFGAPLAGYVALRGRNAVHGAVAAWDASLERHVWVTSGDSSNDVDVARRDVMRNTRLRWLESGEANGAPWNSYSAPGGSTLDERLKRPVRWEDLQGWVEDLTEELKAAETDGTLPVIPGVDALWIGANDGMLIADTPLALKGLGAGNRQAGAIVAEMIAKVKASGQLQPALPPFATRAMNSANLATSPGVVREAFGATRGRTISLTGRRRAWMMIIQFAPLIVIPLMVGKAVAAAALADVAGQKVTRLLAFLERDTTARSTANNAGFTLGKGVRTIWNGTGMMRPRVARKRMNADSLAVSRKLASTYIATSLASRVRDTTPLVGLSKRDRARALQIVRDFANASGEDVLASQRLVDSVWHGVPPVLSGSSERSRALETAMLFAIIACAFGTVASVISAVLFRRGVLTRMFDVEYVKLDGQSAGRLRLLARQVVLFLGLAILMILLLSSVFARDTLTSRGFAVVAIACVFWMGYMVHAIRSPARSVADRVAGTYMVPA